MAEMIEIVKKDGTREAFDPSKLKTSLERAGAPADEVTRIVDTITNDLSSGDTTTEIYGHAFELLKQRKGAFAARYSLKEAVAELGPTGYPFESFLAEVLTEKGFEAKTDTYLQGACVAHELDVVAENDERIILAEAKFHNQSGPKSDLKVALYVKARFDDLKANGYDREVNGRSVEHWLVTNTKFTSQAREYGECAGLTMISWGDSNHPSIENVKTMIEDSALQPVTALTTLSTTDKRNLTKEGTVLCRDLSREDGEALDAVGIRGDKKEAVLDEANHLCGA